MSLARQYAYPGPAGEQRAFNSTAAQPTSWGMPLQPMQPFQPPQQQAYTGHPLGIAVTTPGAPRPMLYRAYRKNKSRKQRSRKHRSRNNRSRRN